MTTHANKLLPDIFPESSAPRRRTPIQKLSGAVEARVLWSVLIGSISVPLYGLLLTVFRLATPSDAKTSPNAAEAFFWLTIAAAVLAAIAGVISLVDRKESKGLHDDIVKNQREASIRTLCKSIRRWLTEMHTKLGSKDYRVTLLLCVEHEGELRLQPCFRDKFHSISDQSAMPRISPDSRTRCEGVAGNAWYSDQAEEIASDVVPSSGSPDYRKQMRISEGFARSCLRSSRYYLGLPIRRDSETIGVVTVDSETFPNLLGQEAMPKSLKQQGFITPDMSRRQETQHKKARLMLESMCRHLDLLTVELMKTKGGILE